MRNFNRRDLLKTSGLVAAGWMASPFLNAALAAEAAGGERKKVLFFTKSQTFQHSAITRKNADTLSFAENYLTKLGAENGFDVTCTKDGTVFTPENLKQYDIIAFYTTGDLTKDSDKYGTKKNEKGKDVPDMDKLLWKEPGMGDAGKAAFLDAIKGGKGFIGFHSATDTFHSHGHVRGKTDLIRDINDKGEDDFDPYIQMIGGEFITHGDQQKATLKAIDPKFPGAGAYADASFQEEWYSLKNFAPDLHVILAQDCQGMHGPMYARGVYPETWIHMYGQGRVFYTSMGHREDVWQKAEFPALVVGALQWTSKKIDADLTPNIKEATPEADMRSAAAK